MRESICVYIFIVIFICYLTQNRTKQKKRPLNFRWYLCDFFCMLLNSTIEREPNTKNVDFSGKNSMNAILIQFRHWINLEWHFYVYDALGTYHSIALNLHNKFVFVSLNILANLTHTPFSALRSNTLLMVVLLVGRRVFQSHRMHACIHHYLIWLPRNVLLLLFSVFVCFPFFCFLCILYSRFSIPQMLLTFASISSMCVYVYRVCKFVA